MRGCRATLAALLAGLCHRSVFPSDSTAAGATSAVMRQDVYAKLLRRDPRVPAVHA